MHSVIATQLTHSLQATIPEKQCKYQKQALENQATVATEQDYCYSMVLFAMGSSLARLIQYSLLSIYHCTYCSKQQPRNPSMLTMVQNVCCADALIRDDSMLGATDPHKPYEIGISLTCLTCYIDQ